MSHPVLIFSADDIRGGIIREVLKRSGVEALVFRKALGAGDDIVRHSPSLVIFDTKGCFSEEIAHLKNLCAVLDQPPVLLLGERSVLSGFQGPGIREDACLMDPLDPVLLVEKAKQFMAENKQETVPIREDLEATLKDVLKLR